MNFKKFTLLIVAFFLSLTFTAYGDENEATDYSQSKHWLSLPSSIDKEVDVFYLYPTAWQKVDNNEPNICKIDNPSMLKGASLVFALQSSVFEADGNIYAPYYRQVDVASRLSLSAEEQEKVIAGIPKSDVLAAFDYYIKHYNNGRPFILAGHSQGSNVMIYLLSEYMKENPKIYDRMIAAYVIGYSVTYDYMAKNPHLKFAEGADDTGVIISYNTEAPKVEGTNPVLLPGAIAINPISWTRDEKLATAEESLGSLMPDGKGKFAIVKNYADAQLNKARGVVVCNVDANTLPPSNWAKGVYHSYDYLFYYYNIKENVTKRIASYFSKQKNGYPIDSTVSTTLERTVVPVSPPSTSPKLLPYEISKYSQYGYGVWQYKEGLVCEKRLDIMPSDYTGVSVINIANLLRFFTITDIHIADEEAPAQGIYFGYKGSISSAYSPVMLYTTHVLDAAIQTVNALHKQNPIDFGISIGDTCNNTQYNELRWYIDIIDGKNINPDSGVKDDPIPGPLNDYQDEYKAEGLDKTIPWYQTLGNHDHLWIGTNPVDDYIRSAYISEDILAIGNIFIPGGIKKRDLYMGSIDGRTPYGDIIGVGAVKDFATPPKVFAADPNRRSLLKKEWISEFFKTSSTPIGHGFTQTNINNDFASYSFEPKSNMPIKIIALDDTQREDDPDIRGYGHGSLDKVRYDWLVSELEKGQAEGKLMIISAHIPIGVEGPDSFIGWWSNAYVSEKDLIAKLHTYPNFMLWIAGHRHYNSVTAFQSPDPAHPELGFWQVETSSLRDFPQQFRIFEIVRNSDNTISIITTNVDPAVKDGSPAVLSRSYAIAAQQIFNNKIPLLPIGSYNAELVKQLSPEMQDKIKNLGTPIKQ